jgi:hypothetical protein
MDKAFSALEIKSISEERRVITGLATSPVPDRENDVIDPFGAKFAQTIPLFLYHDSRMLVGTAKLGKPTKDGIPFEATLPKVVEPQVRRSRDIGVEPRADRQTGARTRTALGAGCPFDPSSRRFGISHS